MAERSHKSIQAIAVPGPASPLRQEPRRSDRQSRHKVPPRRSQGGPAWRRRPQQTCWGGCGRRRTQPRISSPRPACMANKHVKHHAQSGESLPGRPGAGNGPGWPNGHAAVTIETPAISESSRCVGLTSRRRHSPPPRLRRRSESVRRTRHAAAWLPAAPCSLGDPSRAHPGGGQVRCQSMRGASSGGRGVRHK